MPDQHRLFLTRIADIDPQKGGIAPVIGARRLIDPDILDEQIKDLREYLNEYQKDFLLEPTVGAYVVAEPDLSVEEMYVRAFIGSKKCKHLYATCLGFYDEGEKEREAEETAIDRSRYGGYL